MTFAAFRDVDLDLIDSLPLLKINFCFLLNLALLVAFDLGAFHVPLLSIHLLDDGFCRLFRIWFCGLGWQGGLLLLHLLGLWLLWFQILGSNLVDHLINCLGFGGRLALVFLW